MDITSLYNLYIKYPNICTDTRNILPNSIFFALKGEKFNGNEFALNALDNGCVHAVVDESDYVVDDRFVLVDDVLFVLQTLAKYHRERLKIPIIAITGTNGKTTTKELTRAVLSQNYNVFATHGNLNNHIGVPLSLLSIDKEIDIAIIEMGANHPKEISELCKIAKPNFGLITNIGKAHLEGFGSFEGVINTKKELYEFINENNGLIFINSDNHILKKLIKCQNTLSYGTKEDDFCRGKYISSTPFLEFNWYSDSSTIINIHTQLIGSYNFENALAAVCIGVKFDVDSNSIKQAIENYYPQNNRSQFIKTKSNNLLLDAYNANPTSMNAAINNFSLISATNKVLILGEMLELGKFSSFEHLSLIDIIKAKKFDKVFLVGMNFIKVNNNDEFLTFENVYSLKKFLEMHRVKNSYVLIKGSRGVKLEEVIELL